MHVLSLFVLFVLIAANSVGGEEPKHTNRLAKESSPYLLQHAHNPVDWYPWGEEAIAKAKRENKMIFLSVGYAACHWCHVMERESFVDPEIAKLLNEKFVCIKVDREERPDVDQIYMTAVQMVSGNGGWPMSVFLLPDTRPFWGGTYFPARTGDRGKATGFLSVLGEIDKAWTTRRGDVENQAAQLTELIRKNQNVEPEAAMELNAGLVTRVASALSDQFDPVFGGFGYSAADPNRPKFPEPANLVFLFDRMNRESVDQAERDQARTMLIKSLDGMISGAMFDHLGGGFHRYAVDRKWQIPHFEKMLYDNGQLVSLFARAFAETKRDEYRAVVQRVCDFVLTELKAPGGAFYSALDADSEGEEGKFYRWTHEELDQAEIDIDDFSIAAEVYRLAGNPNFEGEYFVPDPGSTLTAIAKKKNLTFNALDQRLGPIRAALMKIRAGRQRPITDVKILTAWNGLMIAGLADAGRIFKRQDYVDAAATAADFLLQELRDDDGRLKRSYAGGQAKLDAYVDDYAFLASGLIALHRATNDPRWLATAGEITDKQIELFWDDAGKGFFFTSADHPSLIVRTKDPVDAALPSGVGVSAENLQYLAEHSDNEIYSARLKETLQSLVPYFQRAPAGVPRVAAVLAKYLDH